MKLMNLAVILSMTILVEPAMASWPWSKKEDANTIVTTYLNSVESSQQVTEKTQALTALQQETATKFREIESKLRSGDSGGALFMAKEVLDSVRVKTGIDPKNRIQESFLIATKFPATATSVSDLDENQRNLVIRTISDYRGGLYLDIMNLSKRTSLLYIKAFQAELEKNGGLTKEDKAKIVKDLVKASLVPMPIEDKVGSKIFAFDEDVANEDHTYLFNRELKMFLIEDTQLNVSEDSLNGARTNLKAEILNSLQKKVALKSESDGMTCMKNADSLIYNDDINAARVKCFGKHYNNTQSMSECSSLAYQMLYNNSIENAERTCQNKFN